MKITNEKYELYKWYLTGQDEGDVEEIFFITPGTYFRLYTAVQQRPATLAEYKSTGQETITRTSYSLRLYDYVVTTLMGDDLHMDCWENSPRSKEEANSMIEKYICEINNKITSYLGD